jgi:hypothetical protein
MIRTDPPVTMLLPILLALAALQGRWQQVGVTGTGNPVFIDTRSVRTGKDGIISATVRVVYAKPVKVPNNPDLTSSRAHAMFNCAANSFAVKESWTFHDEQKNRVYTHKVNKIPGYGPTIGGSFGDVAFKHFCAKKPG